MAEFKVSDNTVKVQDQVIKSAEISFLGNLKAGTRILILGNSITRHGVKPDIGWHNDWGMAASSQEKDYVHRLYNMLTESGRDVCLMVRQAAFWEWNYFKEDILEHYREDRDFNADIVIFRLGENVKDLKKEQQESFFYHLKRFIDFVGANSRIIFSTCFWKYEALDECIRKLAKLKNEPLVELGDLGANEENMAIGLFEHYGVSHHPGDLGMERIATRFFSAAEDILSSK